MPERFSVRRGDERKCAKSRTVHRVHYMIGTSARSRSTGSELADISLLARGASNAKWHSGCLAPDRCVESICDWLIRGPLFCATPMPRDRHLSANFVHY